MQPQAAIALACLLLGAAADSVAATDPDRCYDARIDWGILSEQMPVYYTDKDELRPAWNGDVYKGERRYIDDPDRPALLKRAKGRIAAYCEDPDDIRTLYEVYNLWIQGEYCKAAQADYDLARQPRSRKPRGDLEKMRQAMEETCRRAAG